MISKHLMSLGRKTEEVSKIVPTSDRSDIGFY